MEQSSDDDSSAVSSCSSDSDNTNISPIDATYSDNDISSDLSDDEDHVVTQPINKSNQFTYHGYNQRPLDYCAGHRTKINKIRDISLRFNTADNHILHHAKLENEHALRSARIRLSHSDRKQKLSVFHCFAAVIPTQFWRLFNTWLKSGQMQGKGKIKNYTFYDIIEFIRCEIQMKLFKSSSRMLVHTNLRPDSIKSHKLIRKIMTNADVPAQDCHSQFQEFKGQPFTLDPIFESMIQCLNVHWVEQFFVSGQSWVDIDDDKLPNTSHAWKQYGFKLTPTKDNKLKPVIHLMATIGGSFICYMKPDTIGLKLSDMIRNAIETVCPDGKLLYLHSTKIHYYLYTNNKFL